MKLIFKALLFTLLFATSITWANLPYFPIQFPRDDAAHDKNLPYSYDRMTEWWYYNGKIITPDGHRFGYYISYFFMQLNLLGNTFKIPQFIIQITDIDNQKVYGNAFIPTENQAQFSSTQLAISFGKDISLMRNNAGEYVLTGTTTSKQGKTLKFSLNVSPTKDILLINKNGLIDMWNNTNSYYYSFTHMKTSGFLQVGDEKFIVDPQQSLSWMDHQWGDFMISPLNKWMWDSIQLDNGIDINLSMLMDKNKNPINSLANIILPDNTRVYTKNVHVKPIVKNGEGYPQLVEISIPEINLRVLLKSEYPNQEMGGLWEGIGSAEGMYNGKPIKGFAYMETTVKF